MKIQYCKFLAFFFCANMFAMEGDPRPTKHSQLTQKWIGNGIFHLSDVIKSFEELKRDDSNVPLKEELEVFYKKYEEKFSDEYIDTLKRDAQEYFQDFESVMVRGVAENKRAEKIAPLQKTKKHLEKEIKIHEQLITIIFKILEKPQ